MYKGAYRRQVGGNLVGTGLRQAIPLVFRQILNLLKPKLASVGREVGSSLLKAGTLAAGNMIDKGFSKDALIEPFKDEAKNLKRKYLGSSQSGSGQKRRRVTKKRQPNKQKRKSKSSNKKPIARKRLAKKSKRSIVKKKSEQSSKKKLRKLIKKKQQRRDIFN